MKALLVTPHLLGHIWPKAAPLLQKAVDLFDGFDLRYIKHEVEVGNQFLWIAMDPGGIIKAALVLKIVDYQLKKTARLTILGGVDAAEWKGLMADIEQFALALGCKDIEFIGRPGWSKLLPDFEIPAWLYRKRIKG